MAGMRRSEVNALRWANVVDSTDGDGMLVTVRRSKTNQEGETNDVRFVKDGVARAPPDAARCHDPGAGRPRGAVVGADDWVTVHACGCGRRRREQGDCPFGTGRACVRADEPGCVDHRRDARRELEDQPHGSALFCRRAVPSHVTCRLPSGREQMSPASGTSPGLRGVRDVRIERPDGRNHTGRGCRGGGGRKHIDCLTCCADARNCRRIRQTRAVGTMRAQSGTWLERKTLHLFRRHRLGASSRDPERLVKPARRRRPPGCGLPC